MSVLILKNIEGEGPGTIEGFLAGRGLPYRIVEPEEVGAVETLEGFDTVVVMGGPMGVYERDRYPSLRKMLWIIEGALRDRKRLLGVCLGAQLIAHALGARVYKGPQEEVGWSDVVLSPEGLRDPAVGALAQDGSGGRARVFQWHGDTFDMPGGAVGLAGSEVYENQAFRFGERIYGLQFHIEVTMDMLAEWFRGRPDGDVILEEARVIGNDYRERATGFYHGFFHVNRAESP